AFISVHRRPWVFLPYRELQLDFEPRVGVGRADRPLVEFDGAARNGEAQPDTAAQPVAVGFHPVEGVENARQCIFRNSRTMIANLHYGRGVSVPQPDLDAAIARLITDGVAQHIL